MVSKGMLVFSIGDTKGIFTKIISGVPLCNRDNKTGYIDYIYPRGKGRFSVLRFYFTDYSVHANGSTNHGSDVE